MGALIPVIVVVLALIAAGSIAYIAWQLTSKDVQEQLERSLGGQQDSAGPATPQSPIDEKTERPATSREPGDGRPSGDA